MRKKMKLRHGKRCSFGVIEERTDANMCLDIFCQETFCSNIYDSFSIWRKVTPYPFEGKISNRMSHQHVQYFQVTKRWLISHQKKYLLKPIKREKKHIGSSNIAHTHNVPLP